jgi:hypothetical protein
MRLVGTGSLDCAELAVDRIPGTSGGFTTKSCKEHGTGRLLGHHGDGDKADETLNAGHRD